MKPEPVATVESAIDEAARRLTAIDTRGYMASRVVAHLGPQRRWNWRATLVIASAATAAIVLVVRFVDRGIVVPSTPPQIAVTANTSATPTVVPVPVTTTPHDPAPRVHPSPARPAGPVVTSAAESAAEAAWRARAVQPLPVLAPIEGEVSQPEPIDLPLLQLKPLETPPIQLARLDGGRS